MSILEHIGRTPLIPLARLRDPAGPQILVKAEFLNPGGSVKDRIALAMVEAAEASGALRPGGTIVDSTSGNTGAGLALVAARRGYRAIFVCGPKVSAEKLAVLTAYGAQVVRSRGDVAPDHPESAHSLAESIAAATPGSWSSAQYENPANPGAHYATTGPEIWEQTGGRITHLVANAGTGGTIGGTGRFLKEASGGSVTVIAADPWGSGYSGEVEPYLVEGAGRTYADRAFWPATYDEAGIDAFERVSDAESFAWARLAARHEGLLVGGSAGTALAVAHRWAGRLDPSAQIVVIPADTGRGYLSKVFDDGWLAAQDLLEEVRGIQEAVRAELRIPGLAPAGEGAR